MGGAAVKRQTSDLLGVGLYNASEAARLVSVALKDRVDRGTLERWSEGYSYRSKEPLAKRISKPILKHGLRLEDLSVFTFPQLVELLVVAAFRKEGVSMPVVRAAYKRAYELFGGPHPFAKRHFDTNGRRIFVQLRPDDVPMDVPTVTEEISRGQLALEEIVKPLFRNLEYVDEAARRFYPLGRNRKIVLDPERSFGKPIERDSGVPTSVLYQMHMGGEDNDAIGSWYEVSPEGVRDSIEYEAALRKAA